MGLLGRGSATRFHRVHLRALVFDWRRTISSVLGVSIGVTLVLGMMMLRAEVSRPFDSFGPALTAAAGAEVIQVTPDVAGRLPNSVVERLSRELPDAVAVVPFVAGLAPLEIGGNRHGFFVMGAPCTIELLVGPFDCEQRARTEKPADGPGMPFEIPTAIAERLGLQLGQEVRIPGQPAGSTHLGWTFPEFDRVAGINNGQLLFAPTPDDAARLLGAPGFVTAAFVVPKSGANLEAAVREIVGAVGQLGPPRPQVPVIYATGQQTLNLTALSGIIVGILIAINTILLGIEDRRSVLGTIGAIGAAPRSMLLGFLGEGAVVGAIGGILAVPTGFLLGGVLVDRFGRSMLDGSGAVISAHWDPLLLGYGIGAGVLCGVLAIAGPAWRLVREGPLASMASFGVVRRTRSVSLWTVLLGVAMLLGAVLLMREFNGGKVSLDTGSTALFLGLAGLAAVTVWLTPPVATRLLGLLTRRRAGVGRLATADLRRYSVLFATTVAVLTVGAGLAIGSASVQLLAADQVAAQKASRLPDALVIAPQAILDQRQGQLADQTYEQIVRAAGDREISARRTAFLPSKTEPRMVLGISPGTWHATAVAEPTSDPAALWRGLADGEVALSGIAAGRLNAATGDRVELPTPQGRKNYRVAGTFEPRVINDSTLGDIVLVSDTLAARDWQAVRDQVVVRYSSPAEASAHRADFLALQAGLSVYDNEEWARAADAAITRFFEPFTVTGFVVMITAGISVLNIFVLGLIQRRRERAVLRAIGVTTRTEQATIVVQAALLAVLTGAAAALGGLGLIYLQALASPVFYGFQLDWGVLPRPLLISLAGVLALVAAAAAYPLYHASRLETVDVLRAE
ncbi:FtsX-like permease family protein [Nocardia sp. NPDC050712]|uniref:FtsX-like permease family protein n=1 Tax=Nocardia sp. NPDC050712 TaxID=3155518 RepID=UPI003401684D